jgi:hypothetical protein
MGEKGLTAVNRGSESGHERADSAPVLAGREAAE